LLVNLSDQSNVFVNLTGIVRISHCPLCSVGF